MREFQDAAEARPDLFIRYDYKVLLDESRAAIADLLNVTTDTCVFVPNATTGVNTVLRNLVYAPGDVIVYFDTIYGACERSVTYITETTCAEAVKVKYTYPVSDAWLLDEFRRIVKEQQSGGKNVRLAIFDTIVSLPGLRMPFEKLADACRELGVMSCIDGAHGAGHIDLDLAKIDPDFFVSNCHK
jgi:selenocysteine lyase/cysteine desulfurase